MLKSKGKNKSATKGFIWLVIATVISFLNEEVQLKFDESALLGNIFNFITFVVWIVFAFYAILFMKSSLIRK